MTHQSGKFFFLNRPRKFGKSLLTSMLHSYFSGRKDLFKGLAIDKLERYITIKGYDEMFETYKLDIPNHEVELGMMKALIPYFVNPDTQTTNNTVTYMGRALLKGDIDGMMELLQKFLATIPYTANTNYEGHYQQVLYIIFTLMGAWADVEVHTPRGRVDVVMIFQKHLYLFELKLDASAETAMRQIDLKDYPSRFALSGYPMTKVAVNFDSTTRTVKDWKVE